MGQEPGTDAEVIGRAEVQPDSQVALPAEVRAALRLSVGDEVEFTISHDGEVTLRAMTEVPGDQRWFWDPDWQAGEREASEQIARGDLPVYDDMDTLFADIR